MAPQIKIPMSILILIVLGKITKRFQKANLKIKLEKCQFVKRELCFLGKIITKNGIKTGIKENKNYEKLYCNHTHEAGSKLHGLVGFYRQYI